jgi:hypothetical protein
MHTVVGAGDKAYAGHGQVEGFQRGVPPESALGGRGMDRPDELGARIVVEKGHPPSDPNVRRLEQALADEERQRVSESVDLGP